PALEHVRLVSGTLTHRDSEGRLMADLGEGGFARMLDGQGKVVEGVGDYHSAPVIQRTLAPASSCVIGNQRLDRGRVVRVYTRPLTAPFDTRAAVLGYLQVGKVPEEVLEIIAQIQRSLLIALPVALLVVGIVVLWAARKALLPLTEMMR